MSASAKFRWSSGIVAAGLLVLAGTVHVQGQAPDSKPPELKLSEVEKGILELINKERAKENLPPFQPNPRLFQAARSHSANMARQNKMDHILDGKDPVARIKEAGYLHSWAGENIAYGARTPAEVVQLWMESPPHKANILNRKYTEIGIGMVESADGVPYYTQVFGAPLKRP
jgi:uncharacterized protein YkwD